METETPTATPDDRAAISYVLLCTADDGAPTDVAGDGADQCPDGEPFVRWEWDEDESRFVAEGDERNTTVTATEYKDAEGTEPVEAEWTSGTYNVTGAVVRSGQEVCTYEYEPDGTFPQNGTVESCENSTGGGNGQGQAGPPNQSEVLHAQAVPLVALLGLGLLLRRRQW